jgi:4-diphosphocytidyl-2-C-methyl-D-erythritol kinase
MTEPLWEEDRPRMGVAGPVKVRVPAKINLFLGVGPTRPDGYHELTTVYHALSLYDEVTARRGPPTRAGSAGVAGSGDRLTLTMEGEGAGQLPLDDSNLALRAARALAEQAGVAPHARLHLRKQIPLAAGLAGGSADAAAALVACDALWGTGLSRDELAQLAATLGSDVPFLVLGGTALGTGRGETVSPVLARGNAWHWVLALADGGLSTPEVYRELDRLREADAAREAGEAGAAREAGSEPGPVAAPDELLAALRQRDPEVLAGYLGNDLQPAALAMRPALRETLAAGHAAGALAGLVSGSGPTCVFLVRDAPHAAAVAEALSGSGTCRGALPVVGPVPGARVV